MPSYDFQCKKCKKIIEHICSVGDRGNQKCDKCDGLLEQIYLSFPEFCIGIGTDTRLSDIAPDENASDEVKTKFKMMKRVKPTNPLKIRTKG